MNIPGSWPRIREWDSEAFPKLEKNGIMWGGWAPSRGARHGHGKGAAVSRWKVSQSKVTLFPPPAPQSGPSSLGPPQPPAPEDASLSSSELGLHCPQLWPLSGWRDRATHSGLRTIIKAILCSRPGPPAKEVQRQLGTSACPPAPPAFCPAPCAGPCASKCFPGKFWPRLPSSWASKAILRKWEGPCWCGSVD